MATFLGLTPLWWDRALVGAAVLTATATLGAVLSHSREARDATDELSRFKIEQAGKIAEASKAASDAANAAFTAGKNANAAQLAISQANERAAKEELKADQTLRAVDARRLSADFLDALQKTRVKGKVEIYVSALAPDGLGMMFDLNEAFRIAGWEQLISHTPPPSTSMMSVGGQNFGVSLVVSHLLHDDKPQPNVLNGPPDPAMDALVAAFAVIHINVVRSYRPDLAIPPDVIRVVIAPKAAQYLTPPDLKWWNTGVQPDRDQGKNAG